MPPDIVRAVWSRLSQMLQLLQVLLGALDGELARNAVEARLVHADVNAFSNWLKLISCGTRPISASRGRAAVDVVAEDARRCRRTS